MRTKPWQYNQFVDYGYYLTEAEEAIGQKVDLSSIMR